MRGFTHLQRAHVSANDTTNRMWVLPRRGLRRTPNGAAATPGSADLQIGSVRLTLRPSATAGRLPGAQVGI
jgi:hypothetical protein